MQVVLGIRGCIEVHHQADSIHMDAAGGHVRRHQHMHPAIAEVRQRSGAGRLGLVTVQHAGRHTLLRELLGEFVSTVLGAGEDDGAAFTRCDLGDNSVTVFRVHNEHVVVHGVDAGFAGVDRVLDGIVQVHLHEAVDVLVERRAEQQALAPGLAGVQDLLHRGQEAHVGHLVGFVQDHDFRLGQVHVAAFHQVDQATGCGDEDRHTLAQRVDLLAVGHAAGDESRLQVHRRHEGREGIVDLHRKFARGCQD